MLVLFAIGRSKRLRSMTNFFLANLAVADLCVGVFCVLPNLSTFLSPTFNSNTPRLYSQWLNSVIYYAINHWAEARDAIWRHSDVMLTLC